jgi:PAS domain S-box-containing protein/excisionase family DNA binding protein
MAEKVMADVRTAPRLDGGVLVDAAHEPDYYSISQAAALLGVSRVSIWRWIGAGLLPAARLGHRTIRIKRADLERALVQLGPAGSHSWVVENRRAGASAADGAEREERVDWREIAASEHLVQFYETDAFLLDAVGDFIGTALRAGDAAIVVATEAHRAGLEERLQADRLDVTAARARYRYVTLDAAETLSRFMVDGAPDPERFAEVIGGIVARAAAGGRRVRIFGEMVALLAIAGNTAAAIHLEELWNDLQQRHAFSLLCAYPMDRLGGETFADLVGDVCAEHSRVVPAESYMSLTGPDDRLRAIAVLQQKAQSLQAEIAERKRAEQELRRKEAELRDFFEQAVVGLHWVGEDGTILWANQAELDLLGYPPEEYIGHHIADFYADPEVIEDILRRLAAKETLHDYEARLRCKDGTIKDVLIHSNVLWDGDTFVHTRCITVDISGRKLAERRLAIQYAVTRILSESETLAEATGSILQCVCETLGWEAGAAWSADRHTGVLRCDAFWHVPAVDIGEFEAISCQRTFAPGVGLPGRVWASEQSGWIPDVLADDNFPRAPYAAQVGLHTAFGFPIRHGNEVLGVIEFFSREIRQPDEDLLAMLAAVGSQIGQFIERQRAEEVRFQLAAIVESSDDTIIGKYLDGVIFSWNAGAERMYGYTAEEVIGRSVAMLVPPDMPNELPSILERLRRGERIERYETVRIRKDGRRIDVSLTISPVRDAAGTISGAATIARDITERKRAEQRLRETAEARDRALGELQQLLRTRDEFLSSAAHDLKNPLANIKGQAQLLQRRAARAERLDAGQVVRGMASIDASATRMVALVDELLDSARLQLGQPLELNRRRTDLVALAHRLAAEHQQTTERHRLHIEAVAPALVGSWDATRLERVLSNLLHNAIKYSPHGGEVLLRVQEEDGPEGGWAVVAVCDQGLGIPPDDLPQVFERFHRGGNVVGRIEGTGIGLAGARAIVESHGGMIAVESQEGAGSTFTVRLPLGTEVSDAADSRD